MPTALAAPVADGMMLLLTARPPRQSLFEGPSTVFWVAVVEDGGHKTLFDAEVVIDHLSERRKTVGRAGCVGDNSVFGVVSIEVDTTDEHGCVR